VEKHRRGWSEQWWAMANNDANQYLIIKGMEVKEFFRLMEVYQRDLKRKIDHAKKTR
jgi:hypothetical protein